MHAASQPEDVPIIAFIRQAGRKENYKKKKAIIHHQL